MNFGYKKSFNHSNCNINRAEDYLKMILELETKLKEPQINNVQLNNALNSALEQLKAKEYQLQVRH